MKKLFLSMAILFAMGTVFTSCGDDASGDSTEATDGGDNSGEGEGEGEGERSACDCMKEVMESEGVVDSAPEGCEWMDKLEDDQLIKALEDCPEMMGMFEMEMPDMDEMMEDMPDMDEMMEDMPDMGDMKDMMEGL